MNKQPYYHDASVLFTGTRPFTEEEITQALHEGLKRLYGKDYVSMSAECQEQVDPEPGDPADLM